MTTTQRDPHQLNTLAGTVIWTYREPGEPVTEDEVIAQMIEAGHTQEHAEWTVAYVKRAPLPRQRPHVESTMCHTVQYHPYTGGHFTYIGR